tara:strand:- start:15 stop:521 length:507 start_codon:yes stop_codon:yes gene_type:complete
MRIYVLISTILVITACGEKSKDNPGTVNDNLPKNEQTSKIEKSPEDLAREGIRKLAKLVQSNLSDNHNFKYEKVEFTAEKTDENSITHQYEGSVKYKYKFIEDGEAKADIEDIMWLDFDGSAWEFDRYHQVSRFYGAVLGPDVKEINNIDDLPHALESAYKQYRSEIK